MHPSIRTSVLIAIALACAAASGSAAAQSLVRGRVVRAGAGVAGVPVQLHRVSTTQQGVVDSAASGAGGAFALRRPPGGDAEGFEVVFATALHHGVRYFGPPVRTIGPPEGYEVEVHDTTSAAAAADSVRVSRRDVFLLPDSGGGWSAVEMVRLRNSAGRTLVAGARPAFGITLPASAERVAAEGGGEMGTAPLGLAAAGGRAWITDPLLPGDRDAFFRYRLPVSIAGTELAPSAGTDTLYLYLPRATSGVKVTGVLDATSVTVDGEPLTRYGGAIRPGTRIGIEWERRGGGSGSAWTVAAVLGVLAAAGAAAWVLLARRRRAAE